MTAPGMEITGPGRCNPNVGERCPPAAALPAGSARDRMNRLPQAGVPGDAAAPVSMTMSTQARPIREAQSLRGMRTASMPATAFPHSPRQCKREAVHDEPSPLLLCPIGMTAGCCYFRFRPASWPDSPACCIKAMQSLRGMRTASMPATAFPHSPRQCKREAVHDEPSPLSVPNQPSRISPSGRRSQSWDWPPRSTDPWSRRRWSPACCSAARQTGSR